MNTSMHPIFDISFNIVPITWKGTKVVGRHLEDPEGPEIAALPLMPLTYYRSTQPIKVSNVISTKTSILLANHHSQNCPAPLQANIRQSLPMHLWLLMPSLTRIYAALVQLNIEPTATMLPFCLGRAPYISGQRLGIRINEARGEVPSGPWWRKSVSLSCLHDPQKVTWDQQTAFSFVYLYKYILYCSIYHMWFPYYCRGGETIPLYSFVPAAPISIVAAALTDLISPAPLTATQLHNPNSIAQTASSSRETIEVRCASTWYLTLIFASLLSNSPRWLAAFYGEVRGAWQHALTRAPLFTFTCILHLCRSIWRYPLLSIVSFEAALQWHMHNN